MENRESIRQLGGDLVVFFNSPPAMAESWRATTEWVPDDLAVVADANATVYEALGTVRHGTPLGLARGSIGPVLKAAAQGRLPKLTSADMLRLGADAAVRADGEIARLHRAGTPDDRIPVSDLVSSLA